MDNNLDLTKMINRLSNQDMKKIDLNPTNIKPVEIIEHKALKANIEQINRIREEKEQRELDYKESVLNSLQGIEKNTALLTDMTLLLQRSNDKQDEIFGLIVEILEIMKSKNQEEAESKYSTVMKKIGDFTEDVSTLQSLWGMGNIVLNAYQSLSS